MFNREKAFMICYSCPQYTDTATYGYLRSTKARSKPISPTLTLPTPRSVIQQLRASTS